ncbi:MAG: heptaprenylglyceryl phosphate synthase [Planifilum sp.]|jgi:putative glycerol-1-phosphate prenyltransferase
MLSERVASWRHVFKLDPNRTISDGALDRICRSGTDAVILGGTDGITYDKTWELFRRVRRYDVPCYQEISQTSAVIPDFDGFLIPVVLNAGDLQWLIGAHHEAIKVYGSLIPWDRVAVEGYVVLNPDSRVARLTRARSSLSEEDVTGYARLAEHLFGMPVVYVEYSGCYGDPRLVRAARAGMARSRLFYGGGIATPDQAREMARLADTVVVGNLIYYNVDAAVQTVRHVKETPKP